jgi:hypothetical protein
MYKIKLIGGVTRLKKRRKMTAEVVKKNDYLTEILELEKLADRLGQMAQFKQILTPDGKTRGMGKDGVFAILLMAKSNGIPFLEALNGALYYVQGRVGMSSEYMVSQIRRAGHTINILEWTSEKCVLEGLRGDSGEKVIVTYTLEDIKEGGKPVPKHPKDHLLARCRSRLKRVLFSDVFLGRVYEIGEVLDIVSDEDVESKKISNDEKPKEITQNFLMTKERATDLINTLSLLPEDYQEKIKGHLKTKFKVDSFFQMPDNEYDIIKKVFEKKKEELLGKVESAGVA